MMPIEDFEWIKERSECSLPAVFELLRQQVRRDVDTRQKMRRPQELITGGAGYVYSFKFLEGGSDNFTVILEGAHLNERVSFLREPHSIKATDADGEKIVEGTPRLNPDGKCVLKIGAKEHPIWYFRKWALEKLFFESGATP